MLLLLNLQREVTCIGSGPNILSEGVGLCHRKSKGMSL